jgi:hypothetical protein
MANIRSTTENANAQTDVKNHKIRDDSSKPLVKTVVQEISLTHMGGVTLKNDARLPGAFVILVVTSSGTRQYTMHHPIGITVLDDDDWVLTPTPEVDPMLHRVRDPNQEEVNRNITAKKHKILVARDVLEIKNIDGKDVYFYKGFPAKSRNEYLEESSKRITQITKDEEVEFRTRHPIVKGQKAKVFHPSPKDRINYLDSGVVPLEKLIREIEKEPQVKADLQQAGGQTFRTMRGPYGDQPQVPTIVTGTEQQAVDNVLKFIAKGINGEFEFDFETIEVPDIKDSSKLVNTSIYGIKGFSPLKRTKLLLEKARKSLSGTTVAKTASNSAADVSKTQSAAAKI